MFTKIPGHVQPYVMRDDECAYKAFARITVNKVYKIILVVNDNEKLTGVLSWGDTLKDSPLLRAVSDNLDATVGDVCSRKFTFLTTQQDKYLHARSLFAEKNFNEIPIVDENGVPVEIFGRFQAFFREYAQNNWLNRIHIAKALGAAAILAKLKGYDRISVIEFGVAGGEGLRFMEIYADEISHSHGVKIDCYGFDSGIGLLELPDHRDLNNFFIPGDLVPMCRALSLRCAMQS